MIKNSKGTIFTIVLVMSLLMILIAVSASNMLMQDVHMVKHLKRATQAQYIAEAGISAALATLVQLGFTAKDTPGNFPQTDLGEGTYDVTVTQSGGRVLLSSVGTVSGTSRTVAVEVKDDTPTSLYYMMSSGSDLTLRALLFGWADINGNMHANGKMRLQTLFLGWIDINTCGSTCCDGSISACDTITTTGNVNYAGSKIEGAAAVTFPNFDYTFYKDLAIASGDYHGGDVTFTDETLSPANGIVYVEGMARFRGVCHINGGIVADRIWVMGELHQHKSGNRNVMISRTMDIRIFHRLETEEALIYSGRDFRVFNVGSAVNVTGILIAARYLRMWDALTYITYNHKLIYPDGLIIGSGGVPIESVSWNR